MLRHRIVVLAVWVVIFVVAGAASSKLSDLLTNRFTLPGTDSQRAERILQDRFGQRSTGSFTLVIESDGGGGATGRSCRRRARRRRGLQRSFRPGGSSRYSRSAIP